MNDKTNAALLYGIQMLRLLLSMELISEDEFKKIAQLQIQHYDPQKKLCLNL